MEVKEGKKDDVVNRWKKSVVAEKIVEEGVLAVIPRRERALVQSFHGRHSSNMLLPDRRSPKQVPSISTCFLPGRRIFISPI